MFLESPNKFSPVETKADPFTLPHLIAWLRTKPADQTYCWEDAGGCLFHQYGLEHGIRRTSSRSIYAQTMDTIQFGSDGIACSHPRTFGAALERAEAIRALSLRTKEG